MNNMILLPLKTFALVLALLTQLLVPAVKSTERVDISFALQFGVQTIQGATNATLDQGVRPSMIIEPNTQRPIMAWTENTNGGLLAAFPVPRENVLGTCNGGGITAANKGWHCIYADTNGRAGAYSAIARHPTTGAFVFVHADTETAEVRSLRFFALGGAPIYQGTTTLNTVASNGLYAANTALFVSAASNDTTVRTAFWTFNKHVSTSDYYGGIQMGYDNLGTYFFADGFLRPTNSPLTIGYYPSLQWSPGNNDWAIAYRGGNGILRYTEQNAPQGTSGCSDVFSMGSWSCSTVDPATTAYGISLHASIGITDPTRIAYYQSGSGSIKLATYVGGSSTCGSGGATGWRCDVIDSVAAAGSQTAIYSALVLVNDRPYIVYSDHNDGANSVIKLARPVGGASGNCGGNNWQCDVVDSGLGTYQLEMPVMKMNTQGRLFIAYHNKTMRRLELASQKYAVAPTLAKAYVPAVISYGATATVQYTVTNLSGGQIDAVFNDELLAGQKIIGAASVSGDCSLKHVSVISDSVQKITFNTSVLDHGSSCRISLPIQSTQTGTFTDTTSALFSSDAMNGAAASATLKVLFPPPPPPQTATPTATLTPTPTSTPTPNPIHFPILSKQ